MPHKKAIPGDDADVASSGPALRLRAEASLHDNASHSPQAIEEASPEVMRGMLHELRVHQIELEMQNEELRRTHAEADAVRERYFDLYDLAPVGYFTVGESGLIVQANLTGATMLGVSRGALVKQPISRFIEKADQDIFYLMRNHLMTSGEAQSCELRMWKKDGAQFWTSMMATAASDVDGAGVLRLVLNDVTQHKQFEQALQKTNLALESAKAVAEKANLAKSEFLSKMSHELRTPLNAVLGFAQLMASGLPAPTVEQRLSIDQILKAGWHLLQLINEILDLAMIESRKLTILREPMSISEVLLDCQAMMEPQAQKREIQLSFPHFESPVYIHADRNRVKQVIINLLSNAIKYGKVGGAVMIKCVKIDANRVRISVKDNGIGLAPEQLAHLFQPFNRLGQEGGAEEGTGIGLVITKQLIELMGGAVGAESRVGLGSVFWFELPTSGAPPAVLEGGEKIEPKTVDRATGSVLPPRRTLLYIEDNPANLALVEQLISRRSDLKLLSAKDAYVGIQLARVYRPDVILMDLNLPGIDGFEALKILHEDPATAHIPVMALSANAIPRDIEKGIQAGFFCYLTKPIKFDEFTGALDVVLHYATENVLTSKTMA